MPDFLSCSCCAREDYDCRRCSSFPAIQAGEYRRAVIRGCRIYRAVVTEVDREWLKSIRIKWDNSNQRNAK